MPLFKFAINNRSRKAYRKQWCASEAGKLPDRREKSGVVRPACLLGPKPQGMARHPCSNLPVPAKVQPETPDPITSQQQRSSPLTLSLSVGAPGMTAVAEFRAKIRRKGIPADVKLPDLTEKS